MPTEFNASFNNGDIILADHVKQFAQPITNLESGQTWYRDDIGTDDDYKVDFSTDNVIENYTPGLMVHFKAATDNTGPATLTIQGSDGLDPPGVVDLASIPLVKGGSTPLDTGDIVAGQVVVAIYTEDTGGSNPRFEVIGGIGSGGGGADKLEDLDDVAITGPAPGQTLRYNGTDFVNAAIGVADVTGLQDELDDKQDNLTAISDMPGLQTALDLKQDESEKGQANGYAGLDALGKVPAAQLPASATTGVSELDDLDDVIITSPASGQVLRHNGTHFVNAAVGIADVTSLQDELDDKQDVLADVSDVPGLQTALNGKQDESEKGQASGYASLDGTGKVPSAQLPTVAIADVTDLQDQLDDKQDILAGVSDVPGLQTALDSKQDESEKGQANGYAGLDATGKVPAAQLPASATTGVSELDDLDDVIITSPASGQVLKHNGTNFVNAAVGFAEVTGLQDELDDKQDVLTGTTDVPGLDTALAGKANTSHTHSAADITSGTLTVARGGTGADNAGGARTNLGAQAQDDALDEISTLTMAKGDIFVHDGTEVSKLSPGSDGQLLSADSTQTTGLTWVSGSSGGAPTGTANKAAYFNSSGALSSTANLSFLASTTRMGVGPTTPASTLHVSSAAAGAVDGTTGLRVSRSSVAVALEAGLSSDSYVGTVGSAAFNLRTNSAARFSLNSSGQCTLFPEIIGGQKLRLSGYSSGAVDGNKGIELHASGGHMVRMEVGTSNDSYVGTISGLAFHLRTNNIPRFSLNSSGQCTLFPEIIGGQKLRLSGYSAGAVDGSKGIELYAAGGHMVRMEVGTSHDSYVGTISGLAFHLRTNNVPRFSLNSSGQCTLFPEIVGGQKLRLSGYSAGAVDGNRGIELYAAGGNMVRMEVGSSNDSYVGTTSGLAFNLRTDDTPRFSINGSGQCTLFPEIIGGQKLKLSGFSGAVNGNKGLEIVNSTATVRVEAGTSNDSYVGTSTAVDFHLRRGNTDVLSLRNGYTELNDNNKLRFKEAIANGTSYVELKGPAALAGNVSLTLPATAGTANQILKTDGSGNLSWGDPHVTGSGTTDRLAFWSSSTGLTSASGFQKSGSTLQVPTLEANSVRANGAFTSTTDSVILGGDWVSGGTTYTTSWAKFGPDATTRLYAVPVYGTSGAVLYRYTDTSEIHHVSSSARFKRNVNNMEKIGKKLKALRPVRFEGTAPPAEGSKEPRYVDSFGLVAEEVVKVFPDLCYTIDGEEPGQPTGVHYDRIGLYLLAGWKEQQSEIETQQAELKELKERLAVLEGGR
jgi:sporulation protein YlmC with PRC-barrel domain